MTYEASVDFLTAEMIAIKGLNGWVNFEREEFHLCARCNHLEMVKPFHYYDGTSKTFLAGVEGNPYDPVADGGADAGGGADLYDIYFWASIKFGWYQFINETPSAKRPTFKFAGPKHKGATIFSAMFQAESFDFVSHDWTGEEPVSQT